MIVVFFCCCFSKLFNGQYDTFFLEMSMLLPPGAYTVFEHEFMELLQSVTVDGIINENELKLKIEILSQKYLNRPTENDSNIKKRNVEYQIPTEHLNTILNSFPQLAVNKKKETVKFFFNF